MNKLLILTISILNLFSFSILAEELIMIDFATSIYPPLVNKWGYNAFWSKPDEAANTEADLAAEYNMSMAAGLVELTQQHPEEKVPAVFTRPDNGKIIVNLQEDYQTLRKKLKKNQLLMFTQFCGTPMEMFETPQFQKPQANSYPNIFPNMLYDYYLKNDLPDSKNIYKFRWSKAFGGGGNSYPLPDLKGMDEYAEAWAEYAEKMFARDKQAHVFGFWQEGTHTIVSKEGVIDTLGVKDGQTVNLNHYLDFYTKVAAKIKAKNPDFLIGGFQLNDMNAFNPKVELDDGTMGTWVQYTIQEMLRREEKNKTVYPLDFFTIQAFTSETIEGVLEKVRYALVKDRFNTIPFMLNRFKHKISKKKNKPEHIFHTSEGLSHMLNHVETLYNAPDLSYVLWSNWKRSVADNFLVKNIMKFLGEMPLIRKNITTANTVKGLAGASDNYAAILLWNTGSDSQKISLSLKNLPKKLSKTDSITATILKDNKPGYIEKIPVKDNNKVTLNFSSFEIKFLIIGKKTSDKQYLTKSTYASHKVWVDRYMENEKVQTPKGMGHYNRRNSTLIAATGDSGNDAVGLSGVVLRDLPEKKYSLKLNITGTNIPKKNNDTKICIRIDYLNRDQSLKTLLFYDKNYGTGGFFEELTWIKQRNAVLKKTSLLDNKNLNIDISGQSPKKWKNADSGSRRIMVSLLVRNAQNGSLVTAKLFDN